MGIFKNKDYYLSNEVINPFKEKVDNGYAELESFMSSYPINDDYELTVKCTPKYRIPFLCGKEVKTQYSEINRRYKRLVECVHFAMNQAEKEFAFLFVSPDFEFKYKKYKYDDLIGINIRENKSYHTDTNINMNTVNVNDNISYTDGNGTSSTEEYFDSGTIILKLKNEKEPIVKIELYYEEDYDMLKSYLEIVLEANKNN